MIIAQMLSGYRLNLKSFSSLTQRESKDVIYLDNIGVFELCQQSNLQRNWSQGRVINPTVNQYFCLSDELDNNLEMKVKEKRLG